MQHLFRNKYKTERTTHDNWPRYITFEEDCKLRKPKWNAKYGGLNSKDPAWVVMWNMTNIPAYAFSDADLNRFTDSVYYAMNCSKGGIFVQLCGWMGALISGSGLLVIQITTNEQGIWRSRNNLQRGTWCSSMVCSRC